MSPEASCRRWTVTQLTSGSTISTTSTRTVLCRVGHRASSWFVGTKKRNRVENNVAGDEEEDASNVRTRPGGGLRA